MLQKYSRFSSLEFPYPPSPFQKVLKMRGVHEEACQHLVTIRKSAVSGMQCSAVQCIAVQCSTVQCRAVHRSAVQFSAVKFSALKCSIIEFSTVQCSAVQCSTAPCSTAEFTAVECSSVRCTAVLYSAVWCRCGLHSGNICPDTGNAACEEMLRKAYRQKV